MGNTAKLRFGCALAVLAGSMTENSASAGIIQSAQYQGKTYYDEKFIGIRVRGKDASFPVGKWIDIVSDTRLGDLNYGVVEVQSMLDPSSWELMGNAAICIGIARRI